MEENKQQEDRYKILYDTSRDAIMTLAPPEWAFTSGNPSTVKMFESGTEEAFTMRGPGDFSPKRQPDGKLSSEKAKEMIDKAIKEGSNFFEWTHKRLNGQDFPATVLLTKIKIDGKEILQATVRDVTEQKKKESELKEKVREVEKLNEMMTGRELKMIELKKKIEKLEKELKTKK